MTDISKIGKITRDRTLIPGPAGHTISGPDWTNVQTRLTNVEAVAETTNPLPNQPNVMQSTASHGLGISAQATITMSTNQMLLTPFFVRGGFTAYQMAVYVEVPQTGGELGLAVYGPSWNLIADFNTVAATSLGWKFSAIIAGVTITAGTNWLAVRANNIAGINIAGFYPTFPMFHSPTSMQSYGAYAKGSVTAFPATFTNDGTVQDTPWLGLGVM